MPETSTSILENFALLTRGKPFALLGLAPTTNRDRVKAAYFAKLQRHSPHEDPAGFRRLRQVYEAITLPGALEAAYLMAPIAIAEARARFCDPLDAEVSEAQRRHVEAAASATAGQRFFEDWAERPWKEFGLTPEPHP